MILTLSLSWASLFSSRNLTLHIIAAAVVVCPATINVNRLSIISESSSFSSGGYESLCIMDCKKSGGDSFPLRRLVIISLKVSMSLLRACFNGFLLVLTKYTVGRLILTTWSSIYHHLAWRHGLSKNQAIVTLVNLHRAAYLTLMPL